VHPFGISDAAFTITSNPTIKVDVPNAGESWEADENHIIVWHSHIFTGFVNIDLSTNNGTTWTQIATNVSSDSTHGPIEYKWNVPNTPSTECLIRISNAAGGVPSDTSDVVFTITSNPTITVDVPNGGENWNATSPRLIVWHSHIFTGNVKIELSTDNGSTWSTIVASYSSPVTATAIQYPWIVPDTPSTLCLVRISDETTASPRDTSDNTFTIVSYDFGDAPDPLNTTPGKYPTLLANNGARHTIVPDFSLGATVDGDPDGQPNPTADGDDKNGTDDEDGITFLDPIVPDKTFNIQVNVSLPTGTPNANLFAWLDFNADGDWDDAGEDIVNGTVVNAGLNPINNIPVPADAVSGQSFTRFRLSTQTNLQPTGLATDGEVEDYQVTIAGGGRIGHYVFCDANGNGQMDGSEPGIANVAIRLFNKVGPQPVKVSKALSGENGYYRFFNVPQGEYSITVDESSLPDGASSSTGGHTHNVLLSDGDDYKEANFGYQNINENDCFTQGKGSIQPPIPNDKSGNDLLFISGTQTFGGGDYSWHNAVDGDYEGWDGTTLARGSGDPSSPAYAVFQFADAETYKFNYVAFQTDNGPDDDGEPYQTTSLEVLVSTTGTALSDFTSVAFITRKYDGTEREWSSLGDYVTAKYVMLKLHQPAWNSGNWRQIVEFEVHDGATKMGASPASSNSLNVVALPQATTLYEAYPNPFNPVTTIEFDLENESNVSIKVFDVNGRNVATLTNSYYYAGNHRVTWQPESLSSGTYFIVMKAGNFVQTKKAVLLK
jgi:hypothetical protein